MHKHLKTSQTFLKGVVFVDIGIKPTCTFLCAGVIDTVLMLQTADQNQHSSVAVFSDNMSLVFT